jgi:hypothetical protein
MAQSRGDPRGIQIHLDDQDQDFIAQAVAKGITAVSALRTRYTLLLSDKPGESGPVRFFGGGRKPFVTVHIDRTHLKHLQDKLRRLGAANVAEHGLTPLKDVSPGDTAAYFNAAFGRQNAADILRNGKPIEINYGRGGVGTTVPLRTTKAAGSSVPGDDKVMGSQARRPVGGNEKGDDHQETGGPKTVLTQQPEPARSAVVKPVPNDWSSSYLRTLFADPGRHEEVGTFLDLSRLSGRKPRHDLGHVWRAVHSLVGDTNEPGKYVLPEVWERFQKALPEAGDIIFDGVIRQLKNFDPSAAENVPELKQAMMQTTAMILSHPLRGATARTGDFLRDVTNLFSDRDKLFKLAISYTSQGHLRKSSGINTSNTRRREIGGVMTAKPHDLDNMGREDSESRSDVEIEVELRRLEPAVDVVKGKLQRNNWDAGRLSNQEYDLLAQYEALEKELQRFRRPWRGAGQRPAGAATITRRPMVHPEQARIDQIEAVLKRLEPVVQPIIRKLNTSNWDMSRVSDDEWESYRRHEQLQKELKKLKAMPLVDVDDMDVPAAAQQNWRPQSAAVRSGDVGDGGRPSSTRHEGLMLPTLGEYIAARKTLPPTPAGRCGPR